MLANLAGHQIAMQGSSQGGLGKPLLGRGCGGDQNRQITSAATITVTG
jgi:hypothetical protein